MGKALLQGSERMNIPISQESLHTNVVAFLRQKGLAELASIISLSVIEFTKAVQYSGSQAIGIIVGCRCPQRYLELFKTVDDFNWMTVPSQYHTYLKEALNAVLPAGYSVHELEMKAKLVEQRGGEERIELLGLINSLKSIMISVATGGPRIQEKNDEYVSLKIEASHILDKLGLSDPNPFVDLWSWYGRWSDGSMPRYQDRRQFISALYQPLIEQINNTEKNVATAPLDEPTGWERVDRNWLKIKKLMEDANDEEDFQAIGHQCREIMISVAQVIYNPDEHISTDGVVPSKTDAKRMIEAYLSFTLPGSSNEEIRRHVKTTCDLANAVQHRRTASRKDALVCMEASRTVLNLIKILVNN